MSWYEDDDLDIKRKRITPLFFLRGGRWKEGGEGEEHVCLVETWGAGEGLPAMNQHLFMEYYNLHAVQTPAWTLHTMSDQLAISPNSLMAESNFKVFGEKEMITYYGSSWLLYKFSLSALKELYREQYGEYACWG